MDKDEPMMLAGHEIISFADIEEGGTAERSTLITQELIFAFADLTGDANPLHTDPAFGEVTPFGRINAQGQLMSSLIIGVIGSILPGPGWFCLGVNADFILPCFPGEEVVASVCAKQKIEALNVILWDGRLNRTADDNTLVRATIKTKFMY